MAKQVAAPHRNISAGELKHHLATHTAWGRWLRAFGENSHPEQSPVSELSDRPADCVPLGTYRKTVRSIFHVAPQRDLSTFDPGCRTDPKFRIWSVRVLLGLGSGLKELAPGDDLSSHSRTLAAH
jgi:hypothetical protein